MHDRCFCNYFFLFLNSLIWNQINKKLNRKFLCIEIFMQYKWVMVYWHFRNLIDYASTPVESIKESRDGKQLFCIWMESGRCLCFCLTRPTFRGSKPEWKTKLLNKWANWYTKKINVRLTKPKKIKKRFQIDSFKHLLRFV